MTDHRSDVSTDHGELRTNPHHSHPLNQRISSALIRERQLSGRVGAHALTLAFVAIAVWCAVVHPWPGAAYYLGLVAAFLGLAWVWRGLAQRPLASWMILGFVLANAILLTVTLLVPNPIDPQPWPIQMKLRPPTVSFFLMLVAWSTFGLSPRLVLASGLIVAATWSVGVGVIALLPNTIVGFGLPGGHPAALARYLDPHFVDSATWASGVLNTLLVSRILAVVVGRARQLVQTQARIERARDNLARHVSANLVPDLAELDEPFGPVRAENVAILFVDIIGFTALCERRTPQAVMTILRRFHEEMAECVFTHNGTLDKFVGDSVMATFGTPRPSDRDAANALACARSMLERLTRCHIENRSIEEAPLQVGIGLHFGPVVLGNIGHSNRLEFAVVGDTVNMACRLESLTRDIGASIVASQALIDRVVEEAGPLAIEGMHPHASVALRGRTRSVGIWTLCGSGATDGSPPTYKEYDASARGSSAIQTSGMLDQVR